MPTNGSSPSATDCSCPEIALVLRRMAEAVETLHAIGRKHDEAYIITILEVALGAHFATAHVKA